MERRVEDGHLRHGRERLAHLLDRGERRRVLQRRERRELGDRAHDLLVDHDRVETALAAVDDAVPDPGQIGARGGVERVDPLGRLVLADEVELQARRAGVDDQDVAHLTRAPCQVGLSPAR